MRRRALALLPVLLVAGCAAPGGPTFEEVIFPADSAALDDAARAAIARMARAAQASPAAPVRLRGFVRPDVGTGALNPTLTQVRTDAVAGALIAEGVPGARITRELPEEVAVEAVPLASRRVEIAVGG